MILVHSCCTCIATQISGLCSTEDVHLGHSCSIEVEGKLSMYDSVLVLSTGRQGRTQSDLSQPQVSVPLISRPVVSVQRGWDHSPYKESGLEGSSSSYL